MGERGRRFGIVVALLLIAGALFVLLRPEGEPGEPDPVRRFLDGGLFAGGGLFGGGVGGREATSASRRVEGRVVDLDGVAVEDGVLTFACLGGDDPGGLIPGGTVRLGEDGEFEGPGCNDEVCVRLQHPALIQDRPWVVQPGRPVELVARPLEQLNGTVFGHDGEPVAGARLMMVPPPEADDPYAVSPFVSRQTSTDADGWFAYFRIERPPCDPCGEASGRCEPDAEAALPTYGEMLLTVRAPGHRIAEQLVGAEDEGPLEIQLELPATPIGGTLVDGDGDAYPRASVVATARGRAYDRHAAEVVGSSFSIDGLGDSTYDLRATQDGVELARAQDVRPGDEVRLVGTPSATGPNLTLEIVDGSGDPRSGVAVTGGPFRFSGEGRKTPETDAEGRLTAAAVIPGEYRIVVRPEGGKAVRRTIDVPDEQGDVELSIELSD